MNLQILVVILMTLSAARCDVCKSKVLCSDARFTYVSSPILTSQFMFPNDAKLRIGSNISSSYTLCLLECAKTVNCKSFNLLSNTTCQLLQVDIFANKTLMRQENTSNHYNLPHSCSSSPCANNGSCIANYDDNTFTCTCLQGFMGKLCQDNDFQRLARIYLDFNGDLNNKGWDGSIKYAKSNINAGFEIFPDRASKVYNCPGSHDVDCIETTGPKVPNCLEFENQSFELACPSGFTFSFWMKYNPNKYANVPVHNLIMRYGRGFHLQRYRNNSLLAKMTLSNRQYFCWTYVLPKMTLKLWSHMAVSFDYEERAINFFFNGELICRGAEERSVRADNVSQAKFSAGILVKYLDDVALYERVLSPEEIWKVYSLESSKTQCALLEGTYARNGTTLRITLEGGGLRGKWSNGLHDFTGYFTGLCKGLIRWPGQGSYMFEYEQDSCRFILYRKLYEESKLKKSLCKTESPATTRCINTDSEELCRDVAGVYSNLTGPVLNISFSNGDIRGRWYSGAPDFTGFTNHKCEGLAYLPQTRQKWGFRYDQKTCEFSWTHIEESFYLSRTECSRESATEPLEDLVYAAHACEKQADLKLWCNSGVIQIHAANFGRTDSMRCLTEPFQNTSCISVTTKDTMKARCDGQKSCLLPVVLSLWGDPCPMSFKYLEAAWKCRRHVEE